MSDRKGKSCVLYLRVSLERQTEGYSLDGQRESLQKWAEFEGMTVKNVYVDAGKSGKSIAGRDEFQRMLDDIAQKHIDYVIVFKLSRFGRNAKDVLVSLSYLQKYGTNLISKEDGLDSSTQIGKMMITILGAVAEMERENILAQTMLGREQKAREGGWNGGFAPYGYTLVNGKFEIVEDEARIVRLVYDKFVNENMGYSAIAAYLNSQGIPKPHTPVSQDRKYTDWTNNHIKRMLTNPLYLGKIAFGRIRQERVTGSETKCRRVETDDYIMSDVIAHEALVSEELYEQARLKRTAFQAAGKPKFGRGRKHLLAGILKCPQCGCNMYADLKSRTLPDGTRDQHLYYQCGHYARARGGQCNKNSIRGEWVEAEVIAYTKQLVQNPQFAQDIQAQIGHKVDTAEIDTEIKNFQGRLKKLERSKANLERDIDNITDDDRNAERKRRDMNTRLNKIYDEIYDTEDQIANCEQRRQAAGIPAPSSQTERRSISFSTLAVTRICPPLRFIFTPW